MAIDDNIEDENMMIVDLKKLYFKYEGPTNDIHFNEYYDSKEHFHEIKSLNIKFDDAVKNKKSC